MEFDAIVVGGSFAGLSAAMQLARARRHVLIVDAELPRNRFSHASHGFFGQDGRKPADIIADARAMVLAYPTVRFVHGEAVHASRTDDGFAVTLASDETHEAARLVLATGVIDELPAVPGLAERWGISVFPCPYCDGYEVAGQQIGVLATFPQIHTAMLLPDWGDTTFFTNEAMVLDDEQRTALQARGVTIETTQVVALVGDSPALREVQLADDRVVAIDALFTLGTTRMASPLAEQLGCAFDDGPVGPLIRTDQFQATTVPGVYAAGDAAQAFANATMASAKGVMAGVAAHQSLVFAHAA
jgi:thioredoxin reductase